MTQGVGMLPVEQSDRDFAANYNRMLSRVTQRDADNIRCGWWDETREVQEVVRHRLNHTHPAATGSVRGKAWRPFVRQSDAPTDGTGWVWPSEPTEWMPIDEFAAAPTPDAAASDAGDPAGEVERLRHKLWMIACHATGGGIPEIEGIDRSINDISVQITASRNLVYQSGVEAGRKEAAAAPKVHHHTDAAASEAGEVERLRGALQYARNLIGPDEIIDAALTTQGGAEG